MTFLNWTGNPFVDSGIAAILYYSEKKLLAEIDIQDFVTIKNLLEKVHFTDAWRKNLHSIFVNHPLSQPSYKTATLKKEKLREFLDQLIAGVEPLSDAGNCIACGQRDIRKRKNRQHIPLTGSGGVLNFFSFATDGADYCDTCAYMVQCSSLTYYACGKLALVHSDSPKIMRLWAKKALLGIHKQIASNNYTGCYNEGYTNPQNALFHITQDLISSNNLWMKEVNTAIRLYHFTNFIQGPELDIYDLPTPVFIFLSQACLEPHRKYWQRVVKNGYYFEKKGKEVTIAVTDKSEDDYKNRKNHIYLKLLAGESIINYFFNQNKKYTYGNFTLLKFYLKEVLAMDDKQIETIKRVADEIALFIRESPKGKDRLRNLEKADKYWAFCNILRRISKERIDQKPKEPLFTYDEFVEQLFPEENRSFSNTRYLILFRLYETLHGWLVANGITEPDDNDYDDNSKSDDGSPTE